MPTSAYISHISLTEDSIHLFCHDREMKIVGPKTQPYIEKPQTNDGGWRQPAADTFAVSIGKIEYENDHNQWAETRSRNFAESHFEHVLWEAPKHASEVTELAAKLVENSGCTIDFLRLDGHGNIARQTIGSEEVALDLSNVHDFAESLSPYLSHGAHLQLTGCSVGFGGAGLIFLKALHKAFLSQGKDISIEAKITDGKGGGGEVSTTQGAFVEINTTGVFYRGGDTPLHDTDREQTRNWALGDLQAKYNGGGSLVDKLEGMTHQRLAKFNHDIRFGALLELNSGEEWRCLSPSEQSSRDTLIENVLRSFDVDDDAQLDSADIARHLLATETLDANLNLEAHRLIEFEGYQMMEDYLLDVEKSSRCED